MYLDEKNQLTHFSKLKEMKCTDPKISSTWDIWEFRLESITKSLIYLKYSAKSSLKSG